MSDIFCPHCMAVNDVTSKYCKVCMKKLAYENSSNALGVNTILKGRYLTGRVIGEGGFGITYIGKDLVLESTVAIKEFFPSFGANRLANGRIEPVNGKGENTFTRGMNAFIKEKNILSSIHDNNIVSVLDFFQENGTAYIVMEYVPGISLREYIQRNGNLNFEKAYNLLRPIMLSLDGMHAKGFIHRDISPSNLIYMPSGKLKLIDLGAALQLGQQDSAMPEMLIKPGYTPEEQYRACQYQGTWTDVYAVCATMYTLITGKVPDVSTDRIYRDNLIYPSKAGAEISAEYEDVLMRGLAPEVGDRIANMMRLVDEFDNPIHFNQNKERKKNLKIAVFSTFGTVLLAIGIFTALNLHGNATVSSKSITDQDKSSSYTASAVPASTLCDGAYESEVYYGMTEIQGFEHQPIFTSNQLDVYAERCFYDNHNLLFIAKYINKTDSYFSSTSVSYYCGDLEYVENDIDVKFKSDTEGYVSIVIDLDLLYLSGADEFSELTVNIHPSGIKTELSNATWRYMVNMPETIKINSKFVRDGIELSQSTDNLRVFFYGMNVDEGNNYSKIRLNVSDSTLKEEEYAQFDIKEIYVDGQVITTTTGYILNYIFMSPGNDNSDTISFKYCYGNSTDEMNITHASVEIPEQIRLVFEETIDEEVQLTCEIILDIDSDGYGTVTSYTVN